MTNTTTTTHTTTTAGTTHAAATPTPSSSLTPSTRRRVTTVRQGETLRYSTPLLAELDREWARMQRRPQALRRVRSWSSDPVLAPIVAEISDLDDLVHATQPGALTGGNGDETLRHLIALAAQEELAGRIVLQRILPGLISRSRRWDAHTPGTDVCDIAVGAAWLAIRSYDVDARSLHVAPSLIADALWIGFRRGSRRKVEQEVPVPGNVLMAHPAAPHEVTPIEALAGTLRAAQRAGVPAADLDLMRRIVAAGSPSKAARNCKVTVRTIRNRRDAASWKIRRALGPDWADWNDPLVAA